MSYAQLIPFKDGKAQIDGPEFSNAHGFAPRIWDALFKAYKLGNLSSPWNSWINNNFKDLTDLAFRFDLPMFERATLAFTFERFYVKREHFHQLADDLRAFDEKYPTGSISHLKAVADWIERSDAEAISLRGTSVSENPWFEKGICLHCGQRTDELVPIPMEKGWEIYEELKASNPPEKISNKL